MSLATVASVVGIAAGADTLLNSGSSGGQNPGQATSGVANINQFAQASLPAVNSQYTNLLKTLQSQGAGVNSTIDPSILQAFLNQSGINPATLINAGNQAGWQSTAAGQQDMTAGNSMLGAGQSILNTAFDPQNALYNQQQNNVVNQSNAINSMYGLGSSPVGAQITGGADSNFDINWQNNQLQRQATGIQAAGSADQTGSGLLGAGVNATYQGGLLPTQAQQTAYGLPDSAATAYTNAYGGGQNMETNLLNPELQYLNFGEGAAAGNFNAQLANAGFQSGQQQNAVAGLTQGLNTLGNNSNLQNFFGNTNNGYSFSPTSDSGFGGESSGSYSDFAGANNNGSSGDWGGF